ncbi:hypothetical protein L2E82_10338 [Cichorium intybus]|uniref:Uncharacterized protein n=1 Tax=Cichorium intybus TaxID=13427 RepID=A0ACB9GA42_CICIN|nr:hypothetical protein L2E82_10338 [Cichorium intybus]
MGILLYFLLLCIPNAASITFNMTKLSTQDQYNITLEGDAYITNQGLQVTPNEMDSSRNQTRGRATYVNPLHLWDNTSGELASFTSYFSFEIYSKSHSYYGDGLTFLLTGNNSTRNNSMIVNGSSMGLPINGYTNILMNPFVAVEFDTFANQLWDPRNSSGYLIGPHVGISINSLASVTSQKWFHDITDGRACHAWVTYDSVSKNLSVSVTGFHNNTVVRQELYHIIDLKSVLPEWVFFGFSAATGDLFEKNMVISWAFNSSDLAIVENNAPAPTPSQDPVQRLAPRRSHDEVKHKNRTGLVVKVTVGLSVLFSFVAVLAFCLLKMKNSRGAEEGLDVGMNSEFEMGTGPRKFSYRELARPIVDTPQVNQIVLVGWVWENYGTGTLLEVADPLLESVYEEEEIKRLMIVGLWCVHPDPVHRPTMRQVIQVLNSESSLPILPSRMPVASYSCSPKTSLHGVVSNIQDPSSSYYVGRS